MIGILKTLSLLHYFEKTKHVLKEKFLKN